jgi:O-antigen/teichoic acid export membrane protein
VLAFVLSVFVIRRLGPEAYGEYGLLLGIMGLGILLTSLGFAEILGKYVPRQLAENGRGGVGSLIRWTFAWRIALSLLLVALFALLAPVLSRVFHLPDLSVYIVPLSVLFVSQNLFGLLVAFFNATLGMKRLTAVNILFWSVSLALTLVFFVVAGVSVQAVLWASALATLLALGVGTFLLRQWFTTSGGSMPPGRALWRFGSITWLTGLANFGLDNQSDVLLLGYLLPDKAQIGFYRAAVMPVNRLMGLIFGGWSGLTMPVLSESHAAGGLAGVRKAWDGYVKLMLLLAVPSLILMATTAGTLVPLLYSDQFQPSVGLMQLYALYGVLGFAVGHGLNTLLMQTLNLEGVALRLRLAASGLNILLSVVLIPLLGAAGAIIATCTAGSVMWIAETFIVIRKYQLIYPWAFALKILVASIAGAAAVLLVPAGTWVGLVAQGVLFGLVFLALCYLLKPLDQQDKALLTRVNPRFARLLVLF